MQSIRNIVDNFKRHGTVTDLRKSTVANRERPVHEDDVNTVRRAYSKKRKLSIRKTSLKTGFLENTGAERTRKTQACYSD